MSGWDDMRRSMERDIAEMKAAIEQRAAEKRALEQLRERMAIRVERVPREPGE